MSTSDADYTLRLQRARDLRRDEEFEHSQELLLELLDEYPDDPMILFEVGGSYDVLGEEKQAIPYYREALDAGLAGDERQECLICLGSSLRVVGEYEDAVACLEQAVDEYPTRNSGRAFLALAHYSNGRPDEAVRLLLDLLLSTTNDADIRSFADALEYYRDNLDLDDEE